MTAAEAKPMCAGQHAVFDSTDPRQHAKAAAICATCPVIDACRVLLADVLADAKTVGIEGTWAGRGFNINHWRRWAS